MFELYRTVFGTFAKSIDLQAELDSIASDRRRHKESLDIVRNLVVVSAIGYAAVKTHSWALFVLYGFAGTSLVLYGTTFAREFLAHHRPPNLSFRLLLLLLTLVLLLGLMWLGSEGIAQLIANADKH